MLITIIPFIFKRKEAIIIVLLYLLIGALGIPVFAGYSGGVEKMYGPTSGFLWGFVFVVVILSFFKNNNNFREVFVLVLVGHLILFIPGLVVLKIQIPHSEIGVLFIKFVPAIIIKSVLAGFIVSQLKRLNNIDY